MPDLKMAGATPKSGKPLCASCKVRYDREGTELRGTG